MFNAATLSFDSLTAGSGGSPGTNIFQIYNYTGDPAIGGEALLPDFPIFTPLVFTEATLSVVVGGTIQSINLGDLSPGPLSLPTLQFSSETQFSSATFAARISPATFSLSNGLSYSVFNTLVQFTLLPSSGDTLVADIDLGVIEIEASELSSEPSPIPEPSTIFVAIPLLILFRKYQRARS